MYNEEQKVKFIRSYTHSVYTAKAATIVFNNFEKYEEEWGADLCTRSTEVLQPIIEEMVGLRSKSKWMSLSILRAYAKWCMAMNVPGACDGILHVEIIGVDKIRRQMVSSPTHLQICLNELLTPESDETIDNVYRCYFWMAFGGIREDDSFSVSAQCVDFDRMVINYNVTEFPIYREALLAFKNAVQLTDFAQFNPEYHEPIRRKRVPGDELMRGIMAQSNSLAIRSTLSRKFAAAIESGRTKCKLSYGRVRLSGLFYRTYEMERAGIPVDFSDVATEFMNNKTYALHKDSEIMYKQNRVESEYRDDYMRWKIAFSM